MPKTEALKGLQWRCIGPFRGGRVVTVAGDPSDPAVFYFGAVAGGVWKTKDAGTYWECVSDGFFKTSSVGALTVADSDPNVLYAGMGETTIRIDVSHGDGVYKSVDGGATWTHLGLEDTRHIAKIRVHPQNPDLVYVAALGHAFGTNQQRGVFRSRNGGKTWEQILFRSDKAGAIDLTIDANNPRILYAAMWEARRSFWNITSGGPDSSIYRSTDGGDSWTELTKNPGLPEGVLGKIAVVASPAKTGRVWALVEAKEGGLYRSDDWGNTWEYLTGDYKLISRAWYYMHLTADPKDADTVYINNLAFWKSIDGGRNFAQITTPHGDNHDLWIDPNNTSRMIQGNDGGACVSFNGGDTWSTVYNQPTSQFYHLDISNEFPYRVYGTQQDNTSLGVPSRMDSGAITWGDARIAGTGESGYIAVKPDDPNVVFVGAVGSSPGGGGALQHYDYRTKQIRLVTVWPEGKAGWGAKAERYRFPWTFPILFSPHDPNVLYAAGNVVFKTTNGGSSWEAISPDLTRADPATLEPSGGPVNKDAIGAETYATVFSFVESPHEAGVMWAGSDDGLLHLTKDGGKKWTAVTPKDLPEFTMITTIEVSPHDAKTAYVAGVRYKHDDYQPYLYKTNDYGKTWVKITKGIREDDFTRVIREDPARRGLLYAGTETGLYVSFNDGAEWQPFQLNLPVCPIHDMKIKDNDLVVATHGRSFWVLDDLTPLHHVADDAQTAQLFPPRTTYRLPGDAFAGWFSGSPGKSYSPTFGTAAAFVEVKSPENVVRRKFLDAGENAPSGVMVYYSLPSKPETKISLEILDAKGKVIRAFENKLADDDKKDKENQEKRSITPPTYIPAEAGLNRFVWDMRYPDGVKIDRKDQSYDLKGPLAVPGKYQVRLTVGESVITQPFEIVKDPRVTTSQKDLEAQFDLLMKLHNKLNETHTAINHILSAERQADEWVKKVEGHAQAGKVAEAAKTLKEKLTPIREALITPEIKADWDTYNYGVRLAGQLAELAPVIFLADFAPTKQSVEVYEHLAGQIDAQIKALQQVVKGELAAFNKLIRETGFDAVIPLSSAAAG